MHACRSTLEDPTYWSDLSEADIATALGISRGTVKSTASRALDALERVLGDTMNSKEGER